MKQGSGTKDRVDRSRGIETLITETLVGQNTNLTGDERARKSLSGQKIVVQSTRSVH